MVWYLVKQRDYFNSPMNIDWLQDTKPNWVCMGTTERRQTDKKVW
jgi:hypothetical protein